MKILIMALSGIGDALMFTPALQKIREFNEHAEIDVLCMFNGVEELYKRLSIVDNVIYHDFMNYSSLRVFREVLRLRGKYDISFNVYPSNRKEYNIISFLAGAGKRAAVKYLRQGFSNLYFLNTHIVEEDDNLHNVEENIRMAEKVFNKKIIDIPGLSFPLTETDIKKGNEFLKQNEISEDDLVIGMHAGCSVLKNHIRRRWEPEKFAELADRLIEKRNARILLFGGPDETELKDSILKMMKRDRALRVDTPGLAVSAAVMKRSDLFISNDSGLMHISAALGLKTLALIGPTSTNYIHPWKTDYRIASLELDCAPCFIYSPKPLSCARDDIKFKCIKELTPDEVFETALNFLES